MRRKTSEKLQFLTEIRETMQYMLHLPPKHYICFATYGWQDACGTYACVAGYHVLRKGVIIYWNRKSDWVRDHVYPLLHRSGQLFSWDFNNRVFGKEGQGGTLQDRIAYVDALIAQEMEVVA